MLESLTSAHASLLELGVVLALEGFMCREEAHVALKAIYRKATVASSIPLICLCCLSPLTHNNDFPELFLLSLCLVLSII